MPNIFIGPMSKNVVDAVIDVSNSENTTIGLIPSRRQIEYNGGYVNNWSTKDFAQYVKSRTTRVLLQRDHGGVLQGDVVDDGYESFLHDAESNFDLIHIDPWKKFKTIDGAAENTIEMLEYIFSVNPNCKYEVGTEEAIHRYEPEDLDNFLNILKTKLKDHLWEKIEYAVIQGGTGLVGTQNIGSFDIARCIKMIKVCKKYNLKSKEHNGDYLSTEDIKTRFELGLDGLNIAPELGVCETQCILEGINTDEQFDRFFNICYESNRWVKWMPENFILIKDNRKDIINVSGHYVFSNEEFIKLKNELPNIDSKIQAALKEKLRSFLDATGPNLKGNML